MNKYTVTLRLLIAAALFVGGVVLLIASLSGWSLILGLPLVTIGSVFLITTYDEIVQSTVVKSYTMPITICSICGRPTQMIPGTDPKTALCVFCQKSALKSHKFKKK